MGESDIMQRKPRNGKVDRLVTKKLVAFAYLQIGVIQAAAGFYTWMVVLNDYGFGPAQLPGNGANYIWGKQVIYAKLKGGAFCNSGLGADKSCIFAPSPECRVVGADFKTDPTTRPLNEFTNPYGKSAIEMPECSVENKKGWFAMPMDEKDGIFNCDPNMKETDPVWANKPANGQYMPFAWYKR